MKLSYITQHLTQSMTIKLSIFFFLSSVLIIALLESSQPEIVKIEAAHALPLSTSLSVVAKVDKEYISKDFSVLRLQSVNNSNSSIQAIIQQNATILDSGTKYLISGKITTYRGEKQIDIYSIKNYNSN